MLHEREADLALIPIADVFSHGGYRILPYGIAAEGVVESVILFSNDPISSLKSIFIDRSSHTSALLVQELLTSINPELAALIRYHRVDAASRAHKLGTNEGLLVIGDRALELSRTFAHCFDLSEVWREQTALPFVFAVWAYRAELEQRSEFSVLVSSMQDALTQKLIFAREWADEHNFPRERAEEYVESKIFYRLDQAFLAGAEEFRRRGVQLNLFPDSSIDTDARSSPVSVIRDGKFETHRTTIRPDDKLEFDNARFCRSRSVDRILSDASGGRRISIQEGLLLAKDASLSDLSLASDLRRADLHRSPGVSYIVDRNINYTNVCTVFCRFCAFYRVPNGVGRKSKKSEGGYLLTKEEIGQKIEEMLESGGVQILLQGGLNPDLGIEYYEDLFRWIKSNYPINLHALSADEILHISRVSNLTLDQVFERLIGAGLDSLPGGGAEILVDHVRRRIARLKSPAEDWLEVHRVAHRMGLNSTCTMMFGVQESWEDRILHMQKLRHLQDETKGFTAFITWPFQDENTKVKRGNTSGPEYLRVQAISRLFVDNISNIQSSWVTMGPSVGQTALFYGANDFGSVMFEENVVSAAGTTYCMDRPTIERNILEAGFYPWRRNIHYQPVG